ncbi:hypothetical protein [Methylobacterium sp. CM6247]
MSKLAEMRRKLAEQEAMASKPQKAEALQADEAMTSNPIEEEALAEIEAVKPHEPVGEPPAKEAVPAGRKAKASPKPVAKVEKRSTSLYLTPAALMELNILAARQGVRPHRLIDDGLRYIFKKHGLDFDALNATE